ncbi:hypothetical protein ACO0QE_003295 [Hanseniaspora vineae]
MDNITDPAFYQNKLKNFVTEETPSLLTLVIDTNPAIWGFDEEKDESELINALESLVVFLNAHLAFNTSNRVCVIAAHAQGIQYLYPKANNDLVDAYDENVTKSTLEKKVFEEENWHKPVMSEENEEEDWLKPLEQPNASKDGNTNIMEDGFVHKKKSNIINKEMYAPFRKVDEAVLEELYQLFETEKARTMTEKQQQQQQQQQDSQGGVKSNSTKVTKSSISGAMSAALTYIHRTLKDNINLRARMLVVTSGSKNEEKSEIFQYIPIMNCIFTASKLKCPIDVVKIGGTPQATFLQQATDATNGVYLHVENTKGLIQYLSTAMFIEPALRQIIVKPTKGTVDFRTSCFLTGKVVAIGYVCSVCLCVLSLIPPGNKCPACGCEFDEKIIKRLKRKPVVKKLSNGVRKK